MKQEYFKHMKNKRRDFLKITGIAGLSAAGVIANGFPIPADAMPMDTSKKNIPEVPDVMEEGQSIIGGYGAWAASLTENKIPALSYRNPEWTNLNTWRSTARKRLRERLAIPDLGGTPTVTVKKQYTFDGLHIEELSWQLPYGRPTDAILLKPANAKGPLPGILAFHDHAGNKYLGTRKITRTSKDLSQIVIDHQAESYENTAWANEVAKRVMSCWSRMRFHLPAGA